jgi:hypothetical protein
VSIVDLVIPKRLLHSYLYASKGYVVSSRLISGRILDGLTTESEAAHQEAKRTVRPKAGFAKERGGTPARSLRSGAGGKWHWAVFGAATLIQYVSRLCGVEVVPSGPGSYSYYEQPGDFLDLHRDKLVCDVAVITCLKNVADLGLGGGLVLYPNLVRESLSHISSLGEKAGNRIMLARGETLVLLGGIVPHEVTPMLHGQERTVSIMCYRMVFDDQPTSISVRAAALSHCGDAGHATKVSTESQS